MLHACPGGAAPLQQRQPHRRTPAPLVRRSHKRAVTQTNDTRRAQQQSRLAYSTVEGRRKLAARQEGGRTEHGGAIRLLCIKADVEAGGVNESRRHAARDAVHDLNTFRAALKRVQSIQAEEFPDQGCLPGTADSDDSDDEALLKRRRCRLELLRSIARKVFYVWPPRECCGLLLGSAKPHEGVPQVDAVHADAGLHKRAACVHSDLLQDLPELANIRRLIRAVYARPLSWGTTAAYSTSRAGTSSCAASGRTRRQLWPRNCPCRRPCGAGLLCAAGISTACSCTCFSLCCQHLGPHYLHLLAQRLQGGC